MTADGAPSDAAHRKKPFIPHQGPARRAANVAIERIWVLHAAKIRYLARRADVFLLSFPKSGRTWLRAMIGYAFADHVGIKTRNPIRFTRPNRIHPDLPRIVTIHDDSPQNKPATAVFRNKSAYRGQKVVLLVRDPRDVIVSWYLHVTHRQGRAYDGTISDFVRDPLGSLASMLAFYDAWVAQKDCDVLLVRYEDMKTDAGRELRRVVGFCGVTGLDDSTIRLAVERSSFERLQKAERQGQFSGRALATPSVADPEAYKVRRGQVGGYRDYLDAEDVAYLDAAIAASAGARALGYDKESI